MVQNNKNVNIGVAQANEIYGDNINVALSTSFANVLVLNNLRKIGKLSITLGNESGSITENYKVFVSNNPDADPTDLTTTDWFEKVTSTALAANTVKEVTITDPHFKVVVQADSASGTPNISIYYRGTSI